MLTSCRKPESAPSAASPAPAGGEAGSVIPERAAEPDLAESEINQRTRPLPRPEDKKHKAPPLHEEMPVAAKAPGKSGFVFSPYNNKLIDVTNIPPGTLVADPTYPAEEKKYFRTPE